MKKIKKSLMVRGSFLFLCFCGQQIFAQQITAVTVTGDTVVIYPDNSWQYKSNKIAAVTIGGDTLLLSNSKWEYVLPFAHSVNDVDGNIYPTVKIGEQVWMAENLRVTRFRDGRPINYATKTEEWKVNRPSYAFYNNDSTNVHNFGVLYSWKSVSDSCLCPQGWRVPTKEDFITLIAGTQRVTNGHWLMDGKSEYWSKEYNSNNQVSGFNARGAGHRNMSVAMKFEGLKRSAIFYTSSISGQNDPYFLSIYTFDKIVSVSVDKYDGNNPKESRLFALSVRCIREEKRMFPENALKPKMSSPQIIQNNNNSQPSAIAIIEESNGMSGRLKFVYIRNLENYPIKVKYRRINTENGKSSTFEISLNSRQKYEVGYNCHTAFLTDICSIYYVTEIISVAKL